jgi:hypothetical protein
MLAVIAGDALLDSRDPDSFELSLPAKIFVAPKDVVDRHVAETEACFETVLQMGRFSKRRSLLLKMKGLVKSLVKHFCRRQTTIMAKYLSKDQIKDYVACKAANARMRCLNRFYRITGVEFANNLHHRLGFRACRCSTKTGSVLFEVQNVATGVTLLLMSSCKLRYECPWVFKLLQTIHELRKRESLADPQVLKDTTTRLEGTLEHESERRELMRFLEYKRETLTPRALALFLAEHAPDMVDFEMLPGVFFSRSSSNVSRRTELAREAAGPAEDALREMYAHLRMQRLGTCEACKTAVECNRYIRITAGRRIDVLCKCQKVTERLVVGRRKGDPDGAKDLFDFYCPRFLPTGSNSDSEFEPSDDETEDETTDDEDDATDEDDEAIEED